MEIEESPIKKKVVKRVQRNSQAMEEEKTTKIITTKEEIDISTDNDNSEINDSFEDQDSSSNSNDFEPQEYIDNEETDSSEEEIKNEVDKINDWDWIFEENYIPPQIPEFEEGFAHIELPRKGRPLDYFLKIFDHELIDNLVKWTNEYAGQTTNQERRKSKIALWRNTDRGEMKGFMGMLIAMSLVKKTNLKEYWNNSRLLCTPGIQELFEYSRFRQLYNSLCLRPIGNDYDVDDIFKIKRIRDRVILNSQKMHHPTRELSVDECMIPFSGKHRWRVFLKSKPVKYGFKAYILAEANSGYVLNWHIHTGDPRTCDSEESSTFKIVRRLSYPYNFLGHHIYMDRYYSGLRIFRYLTLKGFGVCGTVMLNRLSLTQEILDDLNSFQYQDYNFFQFGKEILFSAWKDKRMVSLISNFHSTEIISYNRYVKTRDENNIPISQTEEISKPIMVQEYGKYMGGVDRFDKMLYNYHFYHKNCRWYIRIFTHFLEIAILNSYIIYKKHCERKKSIPMSRYSFHEQLAKDLVEDSRNAKNIFQTPKKANNKTNLRSFIPPEDLFSDSNSKDCKFTALTSKVNCSVCALENKRAQCTNICVTHNAAVHCKCYEKHKEIVKNHIKK